MKLPLVITILLFGISARAQDIPYAEIFLDAVNSLHDTGQRSYMDSSITFGRTLSEFAKSGYVKGYVNARGGKQSSMYFSRAELKELDSKLKGQYSVRWSDDLLPNSNKLSQASIQSYISYMNTAEFQKTPLYRPYYYFSMPVTTRKNTIAIFRLIPMIRPVAGNDLVFIYTRGLSGWKRLMTVWAGAW